MTRRHPLTLRLFRNKRVWGEGFVLGGTDLGIYTTKFSNQGKKPNQAKPFNFLPLLPLLQKLFYIAKTATTFIIYKMENVKLKMNYGGQSFDVKVEDTDRVLLLDVLNDMVDEAEKQGISLPTNPILTYNYMLKPVEITDDGGLMKMFTRVAGRRIINIFIGSLSTPNDAWLMARQVVADMNVIGDVSIGDVTIGVVSVGDVTKELNVVNQGKGKLQVRRSKKTTPTLPLRRSPRKIATQSSQVQGPIPSPPTPQTEAPQNEAATVNEKPTPPRRRASKSTKDDQRFKMPKTTTKRQNVYVQKMKAVSNVTDSSQMVTRGVIVQYEDPESGESDSEGSYIPSDDEDANDLKITQC
ncbi:hypothetical protein RND81_12G067400 [Saponaria officinalis]|uniref:Uncharacterized protein n=1 Tax=Saponaria officinalis TaxID=3572 RepID=A0AAW1H7G1_SAPOF